MRVDVKSSIVFVCYCVVQLKWVILVHSFKIVILTQMASIIVLYITRQIFLLWEVPNSP